MEYEQPRTPSHRRLELSPEENRRTVRASARIEDLLGHQSPDEAEPTVFRRLDFDDPSDPIAVWARYRQIQDVGPVYEVALQYNQATTGAKIAADHIAVDISAGQVEVLAQRRDDMDETEVIEDVLQRLQKINSVAN